jgi:hypothetical protein
VVSSVCLIVFVGVEGFAGGLKISEGGIIRLLDLICVGGGFAGGLKISEGGIIR